MPKHSSGSASRRGASKFLQNFCSLWHKSKGKASVVLLVLLAGSHPPAPMSRARSRGRGGDVGRVGAEVPNHGHGTCPCAPRGILGAAACREQLLAPCARKILHFTPPARRGEVISWHGGVGGFPICWAPALPSLRAGDFTAGLVPEEPGSSSAVSWMLPRGRALCSPHCSWGGCCFLGRFGRRAERGAQRGAWISGSADFGVGGNWWWEWQRREGKGLRSRNSHVMLGTLFYQADLPPRHFPAVFLSRQPSTTQLLACSPAVGWENLVG